MNKTLIIVCIEEQLNGAAYCRAVTIICCAQKKPEVTLVHHIFLDVVCVFVLVKLFFSPDDPVSSSVKTKEQQSQIPSGCFKQALQCVRLCVCM